MLIDTGLSHHHDAHMKAFSNVNSQLHMAEQTLIAINRQKLERWPSQIDALSRIYQVSNTFIGSSVSGEISLLPNKAVAIELKDTINPTAKLQLLADRGIDSKRVTANTTLIEWVNHEAL